jgi:hypothetical protein
MDMIRNRYGNMLLEFCKGNSLFIVNGRVGKDKNIGRFTFWGSHLLVFIIFSTVWFRDSTYSSLLLCEKLSEEKHIVIGE